jgi:hypothetical protein
MFDKEIVAVISRGIELSGVIILVLGLLTATLRFLLMAVFLGRKRSRAGPGNNLERRRMESPRAQKRLCASIEAAWSGERGGDAPTLNGSRSPVWPSQTMQCYGFSRRLQNSFALHR